METLIRRRSSRPKIKIILSSLAATSAVVLAVREAPVVRHWVDEMQQRLHSRIASAMRLNEVIWEEEGSTNLSHRVLKENLWSVSGLKLGQEILTVDLADLEKKLLTIPWIESVQIQKKLPSTILVKYTTHHARALGMRKNRLWSVSATGQWIAPLEQFTPDLPVLANEVTLPVELLWLDALEQQLASQGILVHEINLSQSSGMSALIELKYHSRSARMVLRALGRPEPMALSRLKRVVQYLIKNNILVSAIDLRPGKKVVVNVGKRP